jgi:fibronectin type 3 domain-containing protein
MKKIAIMILVLSMAVTLMARDKNANYLNPVVTDAPNFQLRVHREPNIGFSITNYGVLGSEGGNLYDPETGRPAPSAEYPKNSGINYLFDGMIWIGAVVEDPNNPGQLDTLVSIGDDGWWYGIYEFNPLTSEHESIWRDQYTGDEEIYAEFYDTVTAGVPPDPNDSRPHVPLGLKITQHSLGWNSPGYDEFIVIEYNLENIYNRDLHDVWFGIYYEGDVYHNSENLYGPESGCLDDLCGFIEHSGGGIAWLADNNGQPYNGEYTEISPTGVMGMMLLGSTAPDLRTNFNWWISSINSQNDWGPQLQVNYQGPFPGGGRGTPGGDAAKYRVMANNEHDYDQAYSALDWTGQGWIPNYAANQEDIANGIDTRFLISFGPFDIAAGETEQIAVALVGGNNLHVDPENYSENLEYGTSDSPAIARFYANLDFSDFISKADTALYYFSHGLELVPIGHPSNFRVCDWDNTHIQLIWNRRDHPLFGQYRIYRDTQPDGDNLELITPPGFMDTSFSDNQIDYNTIYYYYICSVNQTGSEGGYSDALIMNSGTPQTPAGLTATPGSEQVTLAWQNNDESDILGYIIHRHSFREPDSVFLVIDTCLTNGFIDYSVVDGTKYLYFIQALDIYGNCSFYSDTVSAIPMGFNSGILLINANSYNPQTNPDYDLMMTFYYQLLENTSYEFTITTQRPYNLIELSQYEIVIWCKDLLRDNLNFALYYDLFSEYLDNGGKLIMAGPKHAVSYSFEGVLDFQQNDFQYRYFNLDAVEYPHALNTEFVGGQALSASYPDFAVDTVRANRIINPGDQNDGRLFGIGALAPFDSSEIIYNYVAVEPDTSSLDGRPIALVHHGENFSTALLEFPLYYVEEPASSEILNQILHEFAPVNIDDDGRTALPDKSSLIKNYPNPFNASTTIVYELAKTSDVTIDIYDILGRRVETFARRNQPAGSHSIVWHAGDLPSGMYFYKLQAGDFTESRRCLLLK